ncbi:SRPBCC family protein [Naumannella halotolerans]|uniref:Polyketide cyclase/dehydrase/lipid transport protein n=1 Tax=Naumannella halotolerans TaxID=993414 RepID=A0A4R7J2J3_9ACTN|nr:SRPBCC family protein [Naumannella halotolerans]TDT31235.1 polyketide cyclase/dehydrase/lipid transport protein [Naumannella halotolerans]
MAHFRRLIRSDLPPATVFAAVLDLQGHTEVVPFTQSSTTDGRPVGENSELLGLTRIGPLTVRDTMTVIEFRPPGDGRAGYCLLVKTGRVVLGWIELSVSDSGLGGSVLRWEQEISISHLPRLFDPLLGPVAGLGYGFALHRLLRRAR